MRLRDRIGLSDARQVQATRFMQLLLVLVVLIGIRRGSATIILNALIGLGITFLPALLQRDYRIVMDPGLALWLTTAVFLHVAGALGPYRMVWWWDRLTHVLSASVVAAAGYAGFRAVAVHSTEVRFPDRLLFVFLLIFVMAFGVVWELLEFGLARGTDLVGSAPLLTVYGLEDTMMDLVFDLVGGVVVALSGDAYLSGVIDDAAAFLGRRGRIQRLNARRTAT